MSDHLLPITLEVVSDTSSEGPETSFPAGSTYPPLVVEVRDADGEPISLTEAVSATLRLFERGGDDPVVEARMDFADRPQGHLRYRWSGRDVDTPGLYQGRITIRFRNGNTLKAPTSTPLTVHTIAGPS